MLAAVDAPKSKSISIAFIALKFMVMGIVTCAVYNEAKTQFCKESFATLALIFGVFFLLGAVLDFLTLLYFYCSSQFGKLQYYVFYAYHILLSLISIAVCFGKISEVGDCNVAHQLIISIISTSIIFHAIAILLMWSTLYFGLKFAHFGSNIIWPIIWFLQPQHCSSSLVSVISFLHGLMALVGLISFLLMLVLGKTSLTAKGWKYITLISLFVMIFCYLIVLLGFLVPDDCPTTSFFIKSYQRCGFVQIVSPFLILLFVRIQAGDPRDKILKKKRQEIFVKIGDNQTFENDQKQ